MNLYDNYDTHTEEIQTLEALVVDTKEHIVVYHNKGKGKVFYGQEPPSGESTITECGVNYQLLAVIIEVAQWETPSCSRPQPATDNSVRGGRSN